MRKNVIENGTDSVLGSEISGTLEERSLPDCANDAVEHGYDARSGKSNACVTSIAEPHGDVQATTILTGYTPERRSRMSDHERDDAGNEASRGNDSVAEYHGTVNTPSPQDMKCTHMRLVEYLIARLWSCIIALAAEFALHRAFSNVIVCMSTKHRSLSLQAIKRLQGGELILKGYDNAEIADIVEVSTCAVKRWRRKPKENDDDLLCLARKQGSGGV
jgi:hypothetical protein